MNRHSSLFLLLCSLCFLFVSCKPEETVYYITTDPASLTVPVEGGSYLISIESNTTWEITSLPDWVSTSITSITREVSPVQVKVTFAANPDSLRRQTNLNFKDLQHSAVGKIAITQKGIYVDPDDPDDPDIPDEPPVVIRHDTLSLALADTAFTCVGDTSTLQVTSNTEWRFVSSSQEWCTVTGTTQGAAGLYNLSVVVDHSTLDQARRAVLSFKTINDSLATVSVYQRPLGISTADDLVAYAADVNAGHETGYWMKDSVVYLLNDIDMSTVANWTPIGIFNGFAAMSITGTFDGNHHVISHLTHQSNDARLVGLFGYLRKATIRNVTLDHTCSFNVVHGLKEVLYLGGICGWNYGATITDCHFEGSIVMTTTTETSANPSYTGGIVGVNYSDTDQSLTATVSSCTHSGTITSSSYVGGITGNNYHGLILDCENTAEASIKAESIVGGLVGFNNGGGVESCANRGVVTSKDALGGVCGWIANSGYVWNCENYVSIASSANTGETQYSDIGGIVGALNSSSIEACHNYGAVSGVSHVGGICGYSDGTSTIDSCQNDATVTGEGNTGGICATVAGSVKIRDCSNLENGLISSQDLAGGICAFANTTSYTAVISGCSNAATITADYYAAGIVAMSECPVEDCTNTGAIATVVTSDADTEDDTTQNIGAAGIVVAATNDVTGCTNEGAIESDMAAGVVTWFNTFSYAVKDNINKGTVTGRLRAAGIVGSNMEGGDISSCTNQGAITGALYLSGIVGFNYKGDVNDCINEGPLTGMETEDDDYFFAGGIAGYNSQGDILDCDNSGDVTRVCLTGEYKYVGGLIGYTTSENLTSCGYLKRNDNSGTVTGLQLASARCFTGALCGFYHSGGGVEELTNTGTVNQLDADSVATSGTGEAFYYGGTN